MLSPTVWCSVQRCGTSVGTGTALAHLLLAGATGFQDSTPIPDNPSLRATLEVFFSWLLQPLRGILVRISSPSSHHCTLAELLRVTVAFCWLSIFNLSDRQLLNDWLKCILSFKWFESLSKKDFESFSCCNIHRS